MGVVGPDLLPDNKDDTEGQGNAGFSVLEAIIAIAILSIAFLPLLGLQSQMTRTSIALERNAQIMEVKRSALAYVQALNPMEHPNGQIDLGAARMQWTSKQISQERPVIGNGGSPGRFVAALYDVKIVLVFEEQRPQSFSVHAMGWRATASILSGI